jgi:hypothetical protein
MIGLFINEPSLVNLGEGGEVVRLENSLMYAVFADQLYVIYNLSHVSKEGKLRSKMA